MNLNNDYEYKDKSPEETIKFCQERLKKFGIKYDLYYGKGEIAKSISLNVKGSTMRSEGKGITIEYALASAYGEFFERLLNCVFFRMNNSTLQNHTCSNNVYRYLNADNVKRELDKYFKNMYVGLQLEETDLLNQTVRYLLELYKSTKCICGLFKDRNGIEYLLPCGFIDIMYGTNGMCAGNTKEEAQVQGISEIIERHIISQILDEKVELVNVTKSLKKQYSFVKTSIERLKKNNDIKILLYQCIEKIEIPIFILVYINRNTGKYIVKVGVHYIQRIAIERCFTELLQGKSEDNMFGLSPVYACDMQSQRNRAGIFQDGQGNYPISIFKYENNVGEVTKEENEKVTNKEILEYYYEQIENQGYSILVSDTSINGFHSYHIVIPELSEVLDYQCFVNDVPRYIDVMNLAFYIKKICTQKFVDRDVEKLYNLLVLYKKNLYLPLNMFVKDMCCIQNESLKKIHLIDMMLFCLSYLNKKKELLDVAFYYLALNREKSNMMKSTEYCSCLITLLKYEEDKVVESVFNKALVLKVRDDLKNNFINDCCIIECKKCHKKDSNKCSNYIEKSILTLVLKEISNVK
ncbi:YcaO-like family protein [[Ruminococcus] gnavus]|uniref:YcaO-like family protein n=1 Tax=Mediterraneibacter gnavus TaxID=33038 RepID=A0AAJ1B1H5_MEDGN|nr:YcaO-like family protein [Mediterraneibacter gnavus]MCC3678824.1 YcaO-like family protein [[Clostridium] nexile]MCB5495432.1 YcaO-like family protein [Mediterraneibacter gnavus]MCB5594681.1 YcaO-like family protein [Mediterraneibacter gnavus]MCB5607389.1 YcaO-like family protein [Mediterraneibacter gnavus]MCB5654086.1 YcaO-like family protein [Mediterraneibacter gnavus]